MLVVVSEYVIIYKIYLYLFINKKKILELFIIKSENLV